MPWSAMSNGSLPLRFFGTSTTQRLSFGNSQSSTVRSGGGGGALVIGDGAGGGATFSCLRRQESASPCVVSAARKVLRSMSSPKGSIVPQQELVRSRALVPRVIVWSRREEELVGDVLRAQTFVELGERVA